MLQLWQTKPLFQYIFQVTKQLVMILTIFTSITKAYKQFYIIFSAENGILLLFDTFLFKYVLCIYYFLYLKKDQAEIQALINFGNDVNAIPPAYIKELGLWTRKLILEL